MVTGRSGLLSPDAKLSPSATTNTSSTTTFGSASSAPFGKRTETDTPDELRSSENGTRLMTSLALQACLCVSPAPPRRGAQCHTHSPLPAVPQEYWRSQVVR